MPDAADLVTASAWTHTGYRHEAFLWRGLDDFLAGTVPFVADAVASGQPVMVALVPHRWEVLRPALGGDADGVTYVDMARLGRNPARIIPAWRRFLDENGRGGRPVRGIGEPLWPGRRPTENRECQLHEALLNQAIDAERAFWLRCPYDAGSLDEETIEQARRSHPMILESGALAASASFTGAEGELAFAAGMPEPVSPDVALDFGAEQLGLLRHVVARRAAGAAIRGPRLEDLVLAVHEIAVNSLVHGGGSGRLRIWREHGALICEVRDRGHIADPMVGRVAPAPWRSSGRGLWLANQLCDLVQVRSSTSGTVVRVLTWT